ncbi:hypothetical protein CGG87_22625 [Vibrio parahaemolyticus]|nr:hypothetical protein CGG87_22625 [Vibrio parahaemolyticus]
MWVASLGFVAGLLLVSLAQIASRVSVVETGLLAETKLFKVLFLRAEKPISLVFWLQWVSDT